ncbi:DtxR family transcriptional regulator [Sedimentisphaera salicampi]|uniref:Transcriptional regulator MntR n=1 Tax=Sedimentisphaera salicampi TaxID=1941349 RepID=A0A1W6LKZ1_9BACT|nr:metal-dependent transcriptional regulator [Sedimentisphaera salicampi]ARN56439.1 Manganese transport regulator [Sedimentisphaera salicampi]OXU15327.1 Manganese transport regulator [Sedimentisphaera salicampi]
MSKDKELSASLEDYLEAIFTIIEDKGAVRAKDIAARLNVKAGSVTIALKSLAQTEHINYKPYEVITLTPKGREEAKEIVRKREILRDFFVEILGADKDTAEQGACGMEHVISESLVKRLICFTEFIQACPRCGNDIIQKFHEYFNKDLLCSSEDCGGCLTAGIGRLQEEKRKLQASTEELTLSDIAIGSKCIVRRLKNSTVLKRFAEMGIGRGAVIEVERVAPLGDPVEVKVRGYHLSIRKDEARYIIVEKQ